MSPFSVVSCVGRELTFFRDRASTAEQFIKAQEVLHPFIEANKALFLGLQNKEASLSLQDRGLVRVDCTVTEADHLERLDLSHNHLTGLPSMLHWPLLTELDLSYNKIRQLPSSFVHMKALETLNLAHK